MPILSDNLLAEFTSTIPQLDLYDSTWKGSGSFGIRVNRGKSGKRFFILYSTRGKRRRLFLGDYPRIGVAEAKVLATQIIEQVRLGGDPAGRLRHINTEGLFKDVAENSLRERKLSHRTLEEYRRIVNKELLPLFSTKLLSQITEREIRAYLYTISQERSAMANRIRAVLSGIFKFGFVAGLCDKNIMEDVEPNQSEVKTRKPRGERRIGLEALQSLFKRSSLLPDASRSLVQFALLSGVPISAVQHLTWGDIRGDYWTTRSGQTIYLTTFHKELLNMNSSNTPLIFSPNGGRDIYKNPRVLLQRLKEVENSKFSWSDITSSIKYQMLKLGFSYADLAIIFGLGRKNQLDPPDTQLVQRSAKRVFTDWSLIIQGTTLQDDGSSNVVRIRRLKRLK